MTVYKTKNSQQNKQVQLGFRQLMKLTENEFLDKFSLFISSLYNQCKPITGFSYIRFSFLLNLCNFVANEISMGNRKLVGFKKNFIDKKYILFAKIYII